VGHGVEPRRRSWYASRRFRTVIATIALRCAAGPAMPTLMFKGKSVIETYHHTVPHHRLEFDDKLSLLPRGEKPGLEGNLIIEGDNLLALKALLPTHAGRVKCIYIDPPYNTGNEGWIYNDNLTQPQFKEWIGQTVGKEGEDATRHDKWCCMMYPRLVLLKELLHAEGVVLVSIDDNELHHLRSMLDEVFGEANLLATIVWEKGRKNDARFFSVGHEYILVYAKSTELLRSQGAIWREPKPGAQELWDAYCEVRTKIGDDDSKVEAALHDWFESQPDKHPVKKLRRYLHVDKFGPWRDRDISWPGGGGPRYDVIHPVTGKPCAVPERGWAFAHPEEMQRQIELGLVVFREDHTKPPFRKAHLKPIPDEVLDNGGRDAEVEDDSDDLDVGMQVMGSYVYKQSQIAVRYLRELMGGKVFPNPKDHEVLARLIRYCSPPDALVLDSFAGSGTTAQAVFEANRLDRGSRQFVLVQQKHDTKEHEKKKINICETVTAKRFRKAARKEGYDARFTYARVGDPLFSEYRDLGKKLPSFEDLAKYIFYTETSRQIDLKRIDQKTGFIGETDAAGGTSYYLLYTPNEREDREVTIKWLDAAIKRDKNRALVIYTERIWWHQEDLRQWERENGRRVRTMIVPFNLK
jgi:adenine-specific DNA-methyltransferase